MSGAVHKAKEANRSGAMVAMDLNWCTHKQRHPAWDIVRNVCVEIVILFLLFRLVETVDIYILHAHHICIFQDT